jgi:hypothetical protein
VSPAALALAGLAALLALIPTRRLYLAGWSRNGLLAYWLALTITALLVATMPAPARFLVPFLIIGYLMPFVTLRTGMDRLRERLGLPRPRGAAGHPEARPPIKDVTPPPDDLTQG